MSGDGEGAGSGQEDQGIGIVSFLTAVGVAVAIFAVQFLLFLLLRNKLARIFKPKTYLVPERERTDPPPRDFVGLMKTLFKYSDRDVIKKCGLDAYFFLRYLKTLLVIFIPIACTVLPILVSLNYVDGRGKDINTDQKDNNRTNTPQGLDTLAWGNVNRDKTGRYTAHLIMAILVVIWVCTVFFFELRVYIKVRQDYLTSAEHRLRASATSILVNNIPQRWLSEDALRGLFDVFPGGIRNVWLNRDLSTLLEKISLRDKIHAQLEGAETDLIKMAKKAHAKLEKKAEKKRRKEMKLSRETKNERIARQAAEDAEAKRMAASAEGTHAGEHEDTPHNIDDLDAADEHGGMESQAAQEKRNRGFKLPGVIDPFAAVGQGIRGVVGRAGHGVDETLETTNGFVGLEPTRHRATKSTESERVRGQTLRPSEDVEQADTLPHASSPVSASADSTRPIKKSENTAAAFGGNTVRKLSDINDIYVNEEPKFWEFWKPPAGGYASPVPQGNDAADYMTAKQNNNRTVWQKFRDALPFVGGSGQKVKTEETVYEAALNADYKENHEDATWAKYLKQKHRPTHHLPAFGAQWMPGIPFVTKKVDTIYWCREELARLNVEIEEDQKQPERFPLMSSAFIQFNHQVASHMACQSLVHHIPKKMAPRLNEISPRDVVWDNMAMSWWQEWLRTFVVTAVIAAMIFLWALPVAFSATLGQLDELIIENKWLSFLRDNDTVYRVATAVAGVLPAALLALLLFLVPLILGFLADFKGVKTGAQKTEFVQLFYFIFLFVQVFLVVSIASFFAASLNELVKSFSELQTVNDVLNLLAVNLPKAANYFFSYMILQALSTSSGTLLQIGSLITWFIIARMFDSTARSKWSRNTKLNTVRWGSFFPVYTNFACIGLIYCVVAPLISIFAIITFSLLYLAHRYGMVYVTRFEMDTGGVLYPRAINQTFTGIYLMELCLAGLFFIVKDSNGRTTCTAHGFIMLATLALTIGYQLLLNFSFSPLFRYLPITNEDEAVLRDEAFQRAQDRRLRFEEYSDDEDVDGDASRTREKSPNNEIELQKVGNKSGLNSIFSPAKSVGTWAKGGTKTVGGWAKGGENQLRRIVNMKDSSQAAEYRRRQREKDLEAQRAIGDALFGGIHDEIEDLTPDERDSLVKHAFTHQALRARRPTVWLPRDDLGISDDEIKRTQAFSSHIWISNEGTALDSKFRVVYGKHPPDFSEIDLIDL